MNVDILNFQYGTRENAGKNTCHKRNWIFETIHFKRKPWHSKEIVKDKDIQNRRKESDEIRLRPNR